MTQELLQTRDSMGWRNGVDMKAKGALNFIGYVRAVLRNDKTGHIDHDTGWQKNLFVLVGREAIINVLANEDVIANAGSVTYVAVGTGVGVPADADIALGTELERKLVGNVTVTSDSALFQAFYTTTEAIGTITELGLFGEDAGAGVDSGTLFEHVLFDTSFSKDGTQNLTVEINITCSQG